MCDVVCEKFSSDQLTHKGIGFICTYIRYYPYSKKITVM